MGYIDLPIIAAGTYPEVATFADLPSASTNNGKVYLVQQSTGIWLINRKSRGLYLSDGLNWLACPEIEGYAPIAGATFTGPISATNLSNTNTGDETNSTILSKLGFTPEDVANKSTSGTLGSSDTLYPTQKAVKTYADSLVFNPSTTAYWFEEFDKYVTYYKSQAYLEGQINGGSLAAGSDATAIGTVELNTNTSANGGVTLAQQGAVVFGLGTIEYEGRVKIQIVDVVNNVGATAVGVGSVSGYEMQNGFGFEYKTDSYGNGNWWAVSCKFSGSLSKTYQDTGIAVLADTWVKLKVVVTSGTTCDYFINGNYICTLNTNTPSVTTRYSPCYLFRQAGSVTTNRKMFIDNHWYKTTFTTPR